MIATEPEGSHAGPPGDEAYRLRRWKPLVGSELVVDTGGDPVRLELAALDELPGRGECFSLLFRGEAGEPALEQRNHDVEHPALGTFPLFLVPVGPGEDGRQRFEAIVNRLEAEP